MSMYYKGQICNINHFTSSIPVLGPSQPPVQLAKGALSPGVKRPDREADHSPPTSAEVKNTWIHTSSWRSA
jgi:hypothetical protein